MKAIKRSEPTVATISLETILMCVYVRVDLFVFHVVCILAVFLCEFVF